MSAARRQPGPTEIALYQRIRAILLNQMENGELRPGDRLPTEDGLCRQFAVSRPTVRQALAEFEARGLIERLPGRGTFVRSLPAPRATEHQRRRLPLPDLAWRLARRGGPVIRHGAAVPPLVVSRELALAAGRETPFFIKVLSDGAGPRAALKRYLHPDLAAPPARLRAVRDYPAALARHLRCAVRPGHGWAEAILAEPRFAMMLKIAVGAPVLSLWTVDATAEGPVLCSQLLLPGEGVAGGFGPP